MSTKPIIITILVVVLIASNAWWFYCLIDAGVTQAHTADSRNDNQQALRQALSLLPVVARPRVSRSEVVAAARLPGDSTVPFEKEGYVWVGRLGLKFNDQGQLVEVSRAWSPE